MKPLFDDTHPEIERRLIAGYRAMTPAQKMQRVLQLNQFGDQLIRRQVHEKHPNAEEKEILLRIASRYLSTELMQKAFGWDRDKEGF